MTFSKWPIKTMQEKFSALHIAHSRNKNVNNASTLTYMLSITAKLSDYFIGIKIESFRDNKSR